jgi:hypothetical protein
MALHCNHPGGGTNPRSEGVKVTVPQDTSELWIEHVLSLTDDPEGVREALEICPYRTFVYPIPLAGAGPDVWARHVGGVFGAHEMEPGEAILPDRMAKIHETLMEGKTVLILARSSEVRNHVRREIVAWCFGVLQ